MNILLALSLMITIASAESFLPKSFSLQFEVSEESHASKLNVYSGVLDYQYPANLKYEVLKPYPGLLMANAEKVIKYDPNFVEPTKPGQMRILEKAPFVEFFKSLTGESLKSDMFTTRYDKNDLVFIIAPTKQQDLAAREIIIVSQKNSRVLNLKQASDIVFVKVDGKKKTYKILKLEEKSFPTEHFKFTPPANTKMIKN